MLERRGDAIRFHPTSLASPDAIVSNPVPWRSPAGTKRAASSARFAYVREAFFAARTFVDLDDLNAQAEAWCLDQAADRRCPGEPDRTVREVFAEEKARLLPPPDAPPSLLEQVAASVGKTPYVRFDLNYYSVPHAYVRRVLTVLADPREVRIVDRAHVLARHQRSYDKGARIEDPAHVQALVDEKRKARQHRATDRLAQAAPASQDLLMRAAECGANLGALTAALLRLLERYEAAALQEAILEALERDVPDANAVRIALERRLDQQGAAPPVAVTLPAHVRDRDKPVRPHALESYDELKDDQDD